MDKRKLNGGHSTKSTGVDKRTNPNKKLLELYIAEDFDYAKLSALMQKLYDDAMGGCVKSAALFLAYILGKPKETKDIEISLNKNFPEWLDEC